MGREDLAGIERNDRDLGLIDDGQDPPTGVGGSDLEVIQAAAPAQGARRTIVADAATASRASALMHHHLAKTPEKARNSAACTQSGGAVWAYRRRLMGYPAPVGRRTIRRVAGAAQHGGVGHVERRTASGERHDVVDGEIARRMGRTLIARTPVPVLATPGTQHAGAQTLPGPRAVQGVVPAAVGLAGVLGTAATRVAGDDTTDRAQLHPPIVDGVAGGVYSLAVLRLGVHGSPDRTRSFTTRRASWSTGGALRGDGLRSASDRIATTDIELVRLAGSS